MSVSTIGFYCESTGACKISYKNKTVLNESLIFNVSVDWFRFESCTFRIQV
jgi:hypothetical protein